ncbi:uncharacterized protein DDB_G0271670-like isoform X1 [Seriola aureovittata]|uniref:uncharacterized protein DDB_G0271670-like isoform X1 n=1 Tax=Seriola aureovittata TaxID=2871759 RepID=UPI0024BE0D00|nr:uncharacterized protein DDB_G0271670-like isoform X1 [Seriola aureovittata]
MACTLNSSYIQNADPLILEKLKACKDFSGSQVAAMETLLLSGKTPYGNVKMWNRRTLENLGILPLYFTRNIWGQFTTGTKRRFLRTFMPRLRKTKTEKRKLKGLFKEITALKTRRGAGCTVGNITQVTVSVTSFPFGYDQTQFDLCLDIPVLKNNLNSICDKVDDDEFQKIILRKLNQAFPSGVSDDVVQVLGSVSRVASLEDISKWSITTADTLAALMKAEDGSWEAAKSKAIISKYLNTSGNTLGSIELNSIDSNLCSLNTSTLKTISPDSIRNSNPLNVASCSSEQKRVLYEISNTSFSSQRASRTTFYNLIKPYLGGAPLSDVKALSTQNINMDVGTFRSLDPNVIADLTVTDVQGLMGSQLQDLKVFENAPVIQSWVSRQVQSDLDRLGLNLTTNRSNLTTSPPSFTSNTNAITSASTTASPSNTNATTSASTTALASPSSTSNTNPTTSASTTASASPSSTSNTNATTSTSTTASPSSTSNTNATTSTSTTASPSSTSNTNATTSTSTTASPSSTSNTNATTSTSTTASPSSTSNTNATTSTSTTESPSSTSNTNATTSVSASASTVTATQGNTSASDATLTTTVTTTDTSTTSGGTELAKYSTSIFLAALLTTVLQIQQLT